MMLVSSHPFESFGMASGLLSRRFPGATRNMLGMVLSTSKKR